MASVKPERVRERIRALNSNPFEVAKRAGLERGYINDFLIGKKKSIRDDKLGAVARSLDCDPEYLLGYQDLPRTLTEEPKRRAAELEGVTGLPYVGRAEAGVWWDAGTTPDMDVVPIEPDPRHPPEFQFAIGIRDRHADRLGIDPSTVVVAVPPKDAGNGGRLLRDGDAVVIRRTRPDGTYELTIRRLEISLEGARLVLASSVVQLPTIPFPSPGDGERVEIIGLVRRAIKIFSDHD